MPAAVVVRPDQSFWAAWAFLGSRHAGQDIGRSTDYENHSHRHWRGQGDLVSSCGVRTGPEADMSADCIGRRVILCAGAGILARGTAHASAGPEAPHLWDLFAFGALRSRNPVFAVVGPSTRTANGLCNSYSCRRLELGGGGAAAPGFPSHVGSGQCAFLCRLDSRRRSCVARE